MGVRTRTMLLASAAVVPFFCHGQTLIGLKATTGGALYFQAPAALTGDADLPSSVRLFVSINGRISAFANRQPIVGFDVSSDGGVVALNTGQQAILTNAEGQEWMRVEGTARLSPNGSYAAVATVQGVSLLDVERRAILFTYSGVTLPRGQVVANNGLILALNQEPALLRSGAIQPANIRTGGFPNWPSLFFYLDAAGRSVAVLDNGLYVQALTSGVSSKLNLSPTGSNPILSYDGLSITFNEGKAIRRQRLDGSPAETLCTSQSNMWEAVVAGETSCYYSTGIGIYEYEIATRTTRHLASAAYFSYPLGSAAPGTIVTWTLQTRLPFADFRGTVPYPKEFSGYRLLVNGISVPVLEAGPVVVPGVSWSRIRFLVPLTVGVFEDPTPVTVTFGAVEGIFYSVSEAPLLYLRRYAPRFEPGSGSSTITRQAFIRANDANGTRITAERPALPGDAVTLHMRGLGAVVGDAPDDRPPATLLPIAGSIECTVSNGIEDRKAQVESAALSRTELALYEVRIVLPHLPSLGEYFIGCAVGEFAANGSLPVRGGE